MLARVRSNLSLADLWRSARPDAGVSAATLEHRFAEHFGFPHALLFPYARTALHALLLASGWKDRNILCPAYICAEVPHAVTVSGNVVCFVDSAPDHFLPGRAEWQKASRTDAAMAIVTPLFGYPVDKQAEATLRCVAKDIFILYDESQSYGVADESGLQMRDADGVLFSLGLGKMVTALSGGLLLLRDAGLFEAVRALRDRYYSRAAAVQTAKRMATGLAAWAAFREPALSALDAMAHRFHVFPTNPEDWAPVGEPRLPADGKIMPSKYQARLGLRQFAKLGSFVAARQNIARIYEQGLRREGLRTFAHSHDPSWPRYPLSVARRDVVVSTFRREQVQISSFLPYSCADLPIYRERQSPCPNASSWGQSMINLPNWYGMRADQAERVVDLIVRIRDRDSGAIAWPVAAAEKSSPTVPA
jgi:dTDP-4-amino-4,6-dideoxygalactose transaminase